MRIAWLTPADEDSAIGRYSREVLAAMRGHAEVDLWAPRSAVPSPGPAPDVEFGSDSDVLDRLGEYDLVVHNLGDYLSYHADIYEASRRYPGVVVLHDRSLNNFFIGLYRRDLDGDPGYLHRVEQLYGRDATRIAGELLTGRLIRTWSESEQVLQLPFIEDALAGQKGAIVHSVAHARDVAQRWAGPVLQLPFPTYPEWLADTLPRTQAGPELVTLVTAGRVNRNKHIHDVIEVLAADPGLAARVRYLVVGAVDHTNIYTHELAALIGRHGLAGTVKLFGHQHPRAFARLSAQADVHVNLRYPALEGGSASAAEQLASGRPLLVYDTGSFAELPDDAVMKVEPGDRVALREALRTLVANPARRAALGEAGRRVARSRSIDSYVRSLLEFAPRVSSWPWQSFRDRVSNELESLGVDREMAALGRVGRAVAAILPSPDAPSLLDWRR